MINGTLLKSSIDKVRGEIGRNVTFCTPRRDTCYLCVASGYYDPLSDSSYYETCPVCAGAFYINTVDQTAVLARVHWANDEGITATPGGKYYVGDAQLTIDEKYLSLAQSAQSDRGKVIVDTHDMSITKIIPMGTPATNRLRVILVNSGKQPTST